MFGWASEKRSLFGIQGPEIKLHFLLGQLARQLVTWELAQCANMYWFLILISTWVPGCLNISPSFKSWILTSEKKDQVARIGVRGGGGLCDSGNARKKTFFFSIEALPLHVMNEHRQNLVLSAEYSIYCYEKDFKHVLFWQQSWTSGDRGECKIEFYSASN